MYTATSTPGTCPTQLPIMPSLKIKDDRPILPKMISLATAKFIQIIILAKGMLIDSKMSRNSTSSSLQKMPPSYLEKSMTNVLKIAKRMEINLSAV